MRNISRFAAVLGLAALVVVSCAKAETEATYTAAKRYVEAWMHVNHPEVQPTEDGIYIIEDTPGDGILADTLKYLYVEYEVKGMDGKISKTSSVDGNQQIGTYDELAFYGPHVWSFETGTQYAGLIDMVKGMKVGGTRTALVPRWLHSVKDFDTEKEYLESDKGGSDDFIYTIHIVDGASDIFKWQADSVDRFIAKTYGKDKVVYDTLGFRYIRVQDPVNDKAFKQDTTVYINYTGRLLNGKIFDTTIETLAKDNGLYKKGKSYGPVPVKWAENHTSLKLSESSVIAGFSLTLWQMKKYEKGIGIFSSEFGYSTSGSGVTIPEYSPLLFEIEIVDKPKD